MMKGCGNKQDGRRMTEGDDVGKNTSNDFQLNKNYRKVGKCRQVANSGGRRPDLVVSIQMRTV
jgi:hypothetical protein